jgi:cold shock CspA family protein
MTMEVPLQITFRNMEPLPEAEQLISAEARKLETFHNRIIGCRVAGEISPGHRRKGQLYHVRIDLTLPGKELVIKHEPSLSKEIRQTPIGKMKKRLEVAIPHRNLNLAITDAFKSAGRRLQDYARRQRGDVKTHEPPLPGFVSKLLPEEGYGFLTTPDGREIYFHEQSVLHEGFPRLKVGSQVSFVEERGDKGPQASTVRIRPKRAARRAAEQVAGATG